MRNRFGLAVVVGITVTAVGALATGCGSSGSPSVAGAPQQSTAPAGESTGAAPSVSPSKLISVQVGYTPLADAAVLFLATDSGIFKKHGLDVTLRAAAGPVPTTASLLSGQYQFGFLTIPGMISASLAGQKLQCVSTVDGQIPNDPAGSNLLLASAKSGVTSTSQLSGKTVAVVELSGLNYLEVRKLTDDAGAKNVKFVSIPLPQMPQALQSGRVDAGVLTTPYTTTALNAGAKKLAAPNADMFGGGTIYCFAATGKYLDDNATTAQAFRDAMTEATLYAKDHTSEAKATLVKYLKLTKENADSQVLFTNFDPTLNASSFPVIQDMMTRYGGLKGTMDTSALVWNPKP
jgi:NitT/TauT family transport system substrate-binding protein